MALYLYSEEKEGYASAARVPLGTARHPHLSYAAIRPASNPHLAVSSSTAATSSAILVPASRTSASPYAPQVDVILKSSIIYVNSHTYSYFDPT